jgi:hypothetical protein
VKVSAHAQSNIGNLKSTTMTAAADAGPIEGISIHTLMVRLQLLVV